MTGDLTLALLAVAAIFAVLAAAAGLADLLDRLAAARQDAEPVPDEARAHLDALGPRVAARQILEENYHDPDVVLIVADGGDYSYLCGLLRTTARYALAEWEDRP